MYLSPNHWWLGVCLMCEHKVSLITKKSLTNFTSSFLWKHRLFLVWFCGWRYNHWEWMMATGLIKAGTLWGVLNLKVALDFLYLKAVFLWSAKQKMGFQIYFQEKKQGQTYHLKEKKMFGEMVKIKIKQSYWYSLTLQNTSHLTPVIQTKGMFINVIKTQTEDNCQKCCYKCQVTIVAEKH